MPSTRRLSDRDRAIFLAYQDGQPVRELVDQHGVSKARVYVILHRAAAILDVALRPADKGGRKPRPVVIPKRLLQRWRRRELSGRAVARRIGRNQTQVCAALKDLPRQKFAARWDGLYDAFLGGRTLKQLSRKYKSTPGTIAQVLRRIRLAEGRAYKCPWKATRYKRAAK